MLKIRFSRRGKKSKPTYRIIVSEHTRDTQARANEILGFYNPYTKETGLKEDRIKDWLAKGAQLSPSVHNLLVTKGVITAPKKKASRITKKRAEKIKTEKEKATETKEPVKA